jgi:molybdate transport system substrate-binding protein
MFPFPLRAVLIASLGLSLFSPCNAEEKKRDDLQVFASVVLTESLLEITQDYERDTHQKVRLNFTSSSMAAQQVELGVPVDLVFISDPMTERLKNHKFVRNESTRVIVSSSLVLIVNKESPLSIKKPEDLLSPKVGRIAIADPDAVPSGIHTRLFLEKKNLWKSLLPRIYTTANARVTLAAIEMDLAGVGVVYKADALISRKVRIAYEFNSNDVRQISFQASAINRSQRTAAAESFTSYLMSPTAQAIFKRYGFILPGN